MHNAIFDDLRHFYILCVFLWLRCEIGCIGQIRNAEKSKNSRQKCARKSNTLEHFVKSCKNQGQILRKIKLRYTDIFSRGWGVLKTGHYNFVGKFILKNCKFLCRKIEKLNFKISNIKTVPRGDKK